MQVDDKLVNAAMDFTNKRFPGEIGAGAVAMYVDGGEILISTSPMIVNLSVELCHEVGAICEAYKLNKKILAIVCVSRVEGGKFVILTPCGVCQERLMAWGPEVNAGVPTENDFSKFRNKKLSEIQPFYWRKPFIK